MTTKQISVWKSEFGKAYTERNRFDNDTEFNAFYVKRYGRTRDEINTDWMLPLDPAKPVLEVGANIGNQLRALHRIGFSQLYGVEIQRFCVEESKRLNPQVDIVEGSALDIPFRDNYFNIAFTNNVLIHISPDVLPRVMSEIYRVSGRYIVGFEYYAPELVEIPYRDRQNLLWKGNYPALFLERFPSLKKVRTEIIDCQDEKGTKDIFYILEKQA
ncbi:MAG: pseudaminic acid biosynthesis-associated methylase [Ferrovibrio sp.]